jgi:hypothetical protein
MPERLYALLEGASSPACLDCAQCCEMPWVAEGEAETLPTETSAGVRFGGSDCGRCSALHGRLCSIYESRPLDCRLFPLDIVEHEGEYWWCIFLNCRAPDELAAVLVPRIPSLEAAMTPKLWNQFRQQIALTRSTYPPYAAGNYRLIRRVQGEVFSSHSTAVPAAPR